ESERRYRTLLEQASEGISIFDPKINYREVNSRLCEMLGYTKEELLHCNVMELIEPGDLASNPPRMDEVQAGKTVQNERLLVRKDGTILSAEITSKMLDDGRIQTIIRDISERKQAEQDLRTSEERYRTLVESIPQRIFFKDRDSVFVSVNAQFAQDTGVS